MAGVSSAAFIVYTSANPVPGAEESTLQYCELYVNSHCFREMSPGPHSFNDHQQPSQCKNEQEKTWHGSRE
eukprot:CAMPEP_0114448340 /NCGR_PEP_ID=MMETSP0103-20121206/20273_1 /TAXON_ID=37642 ORGANISM="Paraphysomonas imperforata, Strain PA2" /NCGR_SAMPLE_ID=MMETSP0103 /ASSEMBLY_ACC=CAM_ASM_000201 /LENGTH=70 /DNA_ID=CAMNT_0001620349 /DNA_START=42 /DNA_END=254 /DNA_ORIENTATION=+